MKKINDQQIEAILKAIQDDNVRVQTYIGIQKLFTDLPLVEEPKKDEKNPVK